MLNKFVDKTARKPSGWIGKRMLSNPRGHYKSFRWTLDKLQLKPDDTFLEIGCGGGALLNMALETVKHAKAIDHSSDMVQIAKEKIKKPYLKVGLKLFLVMLNPCPGTIIPLPVPRLTRCFSLSKSP
jgi:Cyclopropane fatty acid synthase and related methyltransferases